MGKTRFPFHFNLELTLMKKYWNVTQSDKADLQPVIQTTETYNATTK